MGRGLTLSDLEQTVTIKEVEAALEEVIWSLNRAGDMENDEVRDLVTDALYELKNIPRELVKW